MVERTIDFTYGDNVGKLTMSVQRIIVRDLEYIASLDALEGGSVVGKENKKNGEEREIHIQRGRASEGKHDEFEYSVRDKEVTRDGVLPFAHARYTSEQIKELRLKEAA